MGDEGEKRDLAHLLEPEDKRADEAINVLAGLFREVLADLKVSPGKWNQLMRQYLNDPRNRISNTSRGRSSTRGNTMKELVKKKMTWNNLQKGIKLLNPVKADIDLRLTWKNGRQTVHTRTMFDHSRDFDQSEADDS